MKCVVASLHDLHATALAPCRSRLAEAVTLIVASVLGINATLQYKLSPIAPRGGCSKESLVATAECDLAFVRCRDWVRNEVERLQRRALVVFRVCEALTVRLSGQ